MHAAWSRPRVACMDMQDRRYGAPSGQHDRLALTLVNLLKPVLQLVAPCALDVVATDQ